MSGPTENRASNAPMKSDPHARIMNLTTARKMLPLVQRIMIDVLACQNRIEELQPEQNRLERHKRDLSWPERQRRYAIQEEVTQLERQLQDTFSEMEQLGVTLVDCASGRVGFPTLVNNRPAYFAWWVGEEDISQWHFATEVRCRTIPPSWIEIDQVSTKSKS